MENMEKHMKTRWNALKPHVSRLKKPTSAWKLPWRQGGPPHQQYVAEVVHIASLLHAVALQDLRSLEGVMIFFDI